MTTDEPVADHSWKRPWSLNEILAASNAWSLAADSGVCELMKKMSTELIQDVTQLKNSISELSIESRQTNVIIQNNFNDFCMLANEQFMENLVEDIGSCPTIDINVKPVQDANKAKEDRIAQALPQVISSLKSGIQVLDNQFELLDVIKMPSQSIDESESERNTPQSEIVANEPIYQAKDPYENRHMPHLIGTSLFVEDDTLGIGFIDAQEDDNSSEDSVLDDDENKDEHISDGLSSDEEVSYPKPAKRQTHLSSDSENPFDSSKSEDEEFDEKAPEKPMTLQDQLNEQMKLKLGIPSQHVESKDKSLNSIKDMNGDVNKSRMKESESESELDLFTDWKKIDSKQSVTVVNKSDSTQPTQKEPTALPRKTRLKSDSGSGDLFGGDESVKVTKPTSHTLDKSKTVLFDTDDEDDLFDLPKTTAKKSPKIDKITNQPNISISNDTHNSLDKNWKKSIPENVNDTKKTETKPAEPKSAETKPAEPKSAETKPVETKKSLYSLSDSDDDIFSKPTQKTLPTSKISVDSTNKLTSAASINPVIVEKDTAKSKVLLTDSDDDDDLFSSKPKPPTITKQPSVKVDSPKISSASPIIERDKELISGPVEKTKTDEVKQVGQTNKQGLKNLFPLSDDDNSDDDLFGNKITKKISVNVNQNSSNSLSSNQHNSTFVEEDDDHLFVRKTALDHKRSNTQSNKNSEDGKSSVPPSAQSLLLNENNSKSDKDIQVPKTIIVDNPLLVVNKPEVVPRNNPLKDITQEISENDGGMLPVTTISSEHDGKLSNVSGKRYGEVPTNAQPVLRKNSASLSDEGDDLFPVDKKGKEFHTSVVSENKPQAYQTNNVSAPDSCTVHNSAVGNEPITIESSVINETEKPKKKPPFGGVNPLLGFNKQDNSLIKEMKAHIRDSRNSRGLTNDDEDTEQLPNNQSHDQSTATISVPTPFSIPSLKSSGQDDINNQIDIDFDKPVESSKLLTNLTKSRARNTTRRRPGAIAETVVIENKPQVELPTVIIVETNQPPPVKSQAPDDTDIFSNLPKPPEKKSKIKKKESDTAKTKSSVAKVDIDKDEIDDIFSVPSTKPKKAATKKKAKSKQSTSTANTVTNDPLSNN